MSRPCSNCPFLKDGGIRLRPARAKELAMNALNWDGTRFPCHKSFEAKGGYDQDGQDEFESSGGVTQMPLTRIPTDTADCAGSFLMGWKHDQVLNQYHRICGRVGLLDPEAIQGAELVFDTVEEMVACNVADPMNARRRTK
jgi:hypothetical protein